jgi:hypothetical protein
MLKLIPRKRSLLKIQTPLTIRRWQQAVAVVAVVAVAVAVAAVAVVVRQVLQQRLVLVAA